MKKIVSIMLSLVMVALLTTPWSLNARAASYSGNGTKSSPYLVTNAEQLQGMRDNLSAHYRLANTIDLTGVDFKPIGRLDAPFTGTFACELNADKTPKYIIKNLKQTIAETAYASENKNKWEGGLFGATSGATISGIYVLNAEVTNNNYGDNTGSVAWNNYKPGMNEMGTGILIGTARNTSVSNCGTSGRVGGRSNDVGGLIGRGESSKIRNCYSTAEAVSNGCWNVGGLMGTAKNCTITSCFSTGNARGGQSNTGSFMGSVSAATTIMDCYATGSAGCPKEDATNFTTCRESEGSRIGNCYATGSVSSQVTISKWGNFSVSGCYTLSGTVSDMPDFAVADMGTIKARLNSGNWDASGDSPRLKNIGIVANANAYQPQAVSAQGQTGQQGQSGTKGQDGTSAQGQGANVAVSDVAAMIEKLPDPEVENSITLEIKEDVMQAYAAYEALSTGDKDDFDSGLTTKLYSVRYKLSLLLVSDMITRLKALPEVEELTKDDIDEVKEIWRDYNFIDEEIKAEIDEEYVKKIEDAHAFIEELQNTDSVNVKVGDTFSAWQIAVIVVCALFVIFGVVFNIVSFIKLSRSIKGGTAEKKSVKKIESDGANE